MLLSYHVLHIYTILPSKTFSRSTKHIQLQTYILCYDTKCEAQFIFFCVELCWAVAADGFLAIFFYVYFCVRPLLDYIFCKRLFFQSVYDLVAFIWPQINSNNVIWNSKKKTCTIFDEWLKLNIAVSHAIHKYIYV